MSVNILAKFHAQFSNMQKNDFSTGIGFASPAKKARQWAVQPNSQVYPTVVVISTRMTVKPVVVTDAIWVFKEELGHLMRDAFWGEQGLRNSNLPIYVQFPEPVQDDDGTTIFGFVVDGGQVICLEAGAKIPAKNKALLGNIITKPKLKHLGKPATDFSQPVHKVTEFASSSSPNTSYKATVWKDGTVSCNCLGWTRSGKRDCKHVKSNDIKNILDAM